MSVTAPRIAAWMKKQGVFSTGGNFPNIAPLLAGMMKEAMYHGIMDMRKQIEELQNVRTRKLGEGVTERAWLSVIPEDALNWIDTYTPELVRVLEQSLLDKCRDSIAKGMRDGSTNEEVMKELSKTFDDFSRHRLEAIVRTESMRGYNLGGLVGLKTTRGAVGVEFLAIMDERVTPECEARNGMRLRIDDPHLINNTPPLHPQCRSVLIPLLDDEVDEGWTGDSELAAELEVDVPTIQRKSDIEAVRKVWSTRPRVEVVDMFKTHEFMDMKVTFPKDEESLEKVKTAWRKIFGDDVSVDDVASMYRMETGSQAFYRGIKILPSEMEDPNVISLYMTTNQKFLIAGEEESIQISRRFVFNPKRGEAGIKSVEHVLFDISSGLQGQGLSKKLMVDSMSMYEKMGVDEIHLHAGLSQGGYVWAKYGFVPSETSWKALTSQLEERARSLYGSNVPEGLKSILQSDDARSIWALSDHPDGKALLQGTDWAGKLLLENKESMARYNAYARR